MVVFGQSGCNWEKAVVLAQKLLYSGKSGCTWAKVMYSAKTGCIRAKVVVFGQKRLF